MRAVTDALAGFALVGTSPYSDPYIQLEHDCGWEHEFSGYVDLDEVITTARKHLLAAHEGTTK